MASLEIVGGGPGPVLEPVPVDEAVSRVLGYCQEPQSAWGPYHLAGVSARASGLMSAVGTWSLLWANALNGRVDVSDLAQFTEERRDTLARLIAAVPEHVNLVDLGDHQVENLVGLCAFGYPGFWGPKSTKVSALYRPAAVPVLDGHIARTLGFPRTAFSAARSVTGLTRTDCIRAAIAAMRATCTANAEIVATIRTRVQKHVPEMALLPDLRLVDIILWTSQDTGIRGTQWGPKGDGEAPELRRFQPAEVRKV